MNYFKNKLMITSLLVFIQFRHSYGSPCVDELDGAGWKHTQSGIELYVNNVFNQFNPEESNFKTWDERMKSFAVICHSNPLSISSIFPTNKVIIENVAFILCDFVMYANNSMHIENAKQYCDFNYRGNMLKTSPRWNSKDCLAALNKYGFIFEHGLDNYAHLIRNEKQEAFNAYKENQCTKYRNYLIFEIGSRNLDKITLRCCIDDCKSLVKNAKEAVNIKNAENYCKDVKDKVCLDALNTYGYHFEYGLENYGLMIRNEKPGAQQEETTEEREKIIKAYQDFLRQEIKTHASVLDETTLRCVINDCDNLLKMTEPTVNDIMNAVEYCNDSYRVKDTTSTEEHRDKNYEVCLEGLNECGYTSFEHGFDSYGFFEREKEKKLKAEIDRKLEEPNINKEIQIEQYKIFLKMQIQLHGTKLDNYTTMWCVINDCDRNLMDAGFKDRYTGSMNRTIAIHVYENKCGNLIEINAQKYCIYLTEVKKKAIKGLLGTHMWCRNEKKGTNNKTKDNQSLQPITLRSLQYL